MMKNVKGINEFITNYHNNKDLDDFCNELSIHCIIHYYDEGPKRNQFRIIERGVDKLEAKYIIELAVYKQHYFKFEQTEYTKYFINHYDELKYVRDGNKVFGKRKSGTWQRDSRDKYYLISLELLIEMMKNNMFSLMNYQDLYCLTLSINDNTPIKDIPMFEDDDEFHDEPLRISTTKISKRKYHYDDDEASPDQRSDGNDNVIIMNMDGDVLNSDKSDDEFVGVNEYSDDNDDYSDDDL
ncbi:hypothetical protein M9Y10_043077 [Tritrichomonas musculus]|uniref:Uncharacterized protein n=1 Tax=Tritrichomonas musculus TaxID=1915356 RepID=A0ABR2JYW2_9EUKA